MESIDIQVSHEDVKMRIEVYLRDVSFALCITIELI